MKLLGRSLMGAVCLLGLAWLTGCASNEPDGGRYNPLGESAPMAMGTNYSSGTNIIIDNSGQRLGVLNEITVSFPDVQNPPLPISDTIAEDGTITLFFNHKFHAAGKTVEELKNEIHDWYVPRYWQYGTPVIKVGDRFYHVTGEVRAPGRQVYIGRTTVTKAIATAGGLTEFARHGNIQVTRTDGRKITVDYDKALSDARLDLEVFPGDQVHVKKRLW